MAEMGDVGGIRREDDVDRVAEEVASRLRSRGVEVQRRDTPTDLAMLLDAVEEFELAVEAKGGDLMTAEPPEGGSTEPTDFVLPKRTSEEPAGTYVERLSEATRNLRERAD
jgi:hypothetical protein